MTLDTKVFEIIFGFAHRHPFLDSFGVFMAEYLPYFLCIGALALILSVKDGRLRWFRFAHAALALILARGIIAEAAYFFYHHPRPAELLHITPLFPASGSSLPSGHAAFFFALATVVFYWSRRWGSVFTILAILINLARIFAGVHWPLDILAGALIGLVSAWAMHLLLERHKPASPVGRG